MRYTITRSLGEVLKDYISANNLGTRLKEIEATGYWTELVEKGIGPYTRKTWISKGVLYAEISSSVVRSELMIIREELRRKINEKAGEEIIRQIILR